MMSEDTSVKKELTGKIQIRLPEVYKGESGPDGDSLRRELTRHAFLDQPSVPCSQRSRNPSRTMAATWGYKHNNGPHTWAVDFPDAAGGGQSPVDISTDDVIYDSDMCTHPLSLSYSEEDSFEVSNTGASFKVGIAKPSELCGGPLAERYRLEQLHLHWGSTDDHGSEHTIDGHTYAAELHLVHWNCTKYSSFSEAVNKHDGLAVLGIMIEAGSEHRGFKDLTDTMRSVKPRGKSCKVLSHFQPACLLPENTREFWTYHGSLTTPPCYESVQWIVFKQPVQYSPSQLSALRSLLSTEEGDECIMDNFRPPLPVGDRKIRASFQTS